MKIFYKLLLFMVVLAIAAPFIIKDERGRPLMSLSRLHMPALSKPPLPDLSGTLGQIKKHLPALRDEDKHSALTAYKWLDKQGNWHYSDHRQAGRNNVAVQVDPDANMVHLDNPPAPSEPAQQKSTRPTSAITRTQHWSPLANATNTLQKAQNVNQLVQDTYNRQRTLIDNQ